MKKQADGKVFVDGKVPGGFTDVIDVHYMYDDSKPKDHYKLFNNMRYVFPKKLDDTDVQIGRLNIPALLDNRVKSRQTFDKLTPYFELLEQTKDFPRIREDIELQYDYLGPAYLPDADTVLMPWGNKAALAHELGHAVDYNFVPSDNKFIHTLQKLKRRLDLNRLLPGGTLRTEMAAWNNAKKGLMLDAAVRGEKWEKLRDTLSDVYDTQGEAYGSYLRGAGMRAGGVMGGLLGAGAGLGGAYALNRHGISLHPLDMVYGTAATGLAGSALGVKLGEILGRKYAAMKARRLQRKLRNSDRKLYEKTLEKAKTYSNEGYTEAEMVDLAKNLKKKKKKKKKKQEKQAYYLGQACFLTDRGQ